MDLRTFHPTREQTEAAARLLSYQPFVIDADRHTGVAHSWLYSDDPTAARNADFVFDRRVLPEEIWKRAWDANRRLAAMYDGFIDCIVKICPAGGSYLDFGCNNGYFPVMASLSGIPMSAGVDLGDYSDQFKLLNEITGASAKFSVGRHDPESHSILIQDDFGGKKFDVVSVSAVMCHLPDPLYFLKALAALADRAFFIWNSFVESDELLIRYRQPNCFGNAPFPNGFDDGTEISLGLLKLSLSQLGFPHHEELAHEPGWMPEEWLRPARLHAFLFWK